MRFIVDQQQQQQQQHEHEHAENERGPLKVPGLIATALRIIIVLIRQHRSRRMRLVSSLFNASSCTVVYAPYISCAVWP